MKHEMTEGAAQIQWNTWIDIMRNLEDGMNADPDANKFQDNLINSHGIMYNPITRTPLSDRKVIDILAQNSDVYKDTRYITASQAEGYTEDMPIGNGMSVNIAKPMETVNYSIEEKTDTNGQKEKILMGRATTYYNVSEIKEIKELQKEPLNYSTSELMKIYSNMQKNIMSTYKEEKEHAISFSQIMKELNGSDDPNVVLATYAIQKAIENQRDNTDPMAPETPDEKILRDEFTRALGTSLLIREMSNKEYHPYPPMLGYMERHTGETTLDKIYSHSIRKLEKDLNIAIKAKKFVKENIMLMSMERKSKEEIKTLEEEAKNAGTSLTKADYYKLKPLNIQRIEDRIAQVNILTPLEEKKALEQAKSKTIEALDKEIAQIRFKDNLIQISKSLINKIAKTRKKLGFEANPQKFTQNYKEFHGSEIQTNSNGEEQIIPKTYCFIKGSEFKQGEEMKDPNNEYRKQILNTFANGKEREFIDIIARVYKDQIALAQENAIKCVRSIQGKNARAERYEKFMSKNSNKEITQNKVKTKAKKRTRSVSRPYCDV